jgi:hypothetical protein
MAALPPDGVQDVVFGITAIVGGLEIILSALKKKIAAAVAFLVTAIGVYGTFYL